MILGDHPVMVCEACGRGFLKHPGSRFDPVPRWFTGSSQSDGPCAGRIIMIDRETLIRSLHGQEAEI